MTIKKGIYQDKKGQQYRLVGEATDQQSGDSVAVLEELSAAKKWLIVSASCLSVEAEKAEATSDESFTFISETPADDWEFKYKLALADYQNLLKKTAAEKQEFSKFAITDLLEDILPIYDHLKLSVSGLPQEEADNAWVQGVKYVLKQFKEVLERRGVVEIKTVGEPFDHNSMEALSGEGETVVQEVMPGYQLNGRLIKAAKVIVGQTPAPADAK